MPEAKEVIVTGKTAGQSQGHSLLGRVCAAVASRDECNYLLAGHRGDTGHARRQRKKHHADQLRFELVWKRFVVRVPC